MTTQTETFVRMLRNLEGAWRRFDSGHLSGRNDAASTGTRRMNFERLAELARTDAVCDALDRDAKLAARWNRMERRNAGLPV